MAGQRTAGRWPARARLAIAVAALAVLTSGCALYAWGDDGYDQLGLGDGNDTTEIPLQVGSAADWEMIATGWAHSCGIRTGSSLWCWGSNTFGALGDGTGTDRSAPVQVGSDTDWASVSVGSVHTCAVKTDATLWCWGSNALGRLGDGTTTGRNTPGQVASRHGRR